MEMLFFVFLMALIATTHLVVWADRALGFQVGEQVSPTEVHSITIIRVSSLSVTSSSFTIFGWFNILMLLTSRNSSWMLESLSLVFLAALMATTALVVRAKRASGLCLCLWPPSE